MKLDFEYCECGCHGHEASPGMNVHYWIFNDLKGTYRLHRGHGWMSPVISTHKSFKDAEKAALDDLTTQLIELHKNLFK